MGANLEGASLGYAKLPSANLDRANLRGAYLKGADLECSSFELANLQGAYLAHAKLNRAWFRNANLTGANLNMAKIWWCHFQGAQVKNANFFKVDLSYANLSRVRGLVQSQMDKTFIRTGLEFEDPDIKTVKLPSDLELPEARALD